MSKIIFSFCLLALCFTDVNGQNNEVIINAVHLEGNEKTRPTVIFRELDIKIGDTISLAQLDEIFERNKLRILGTGLFNSVVINLKNYKPSSKQTDIQISFQENWYLFPVPIFELADRNFSVWWEEQNKSLSRVNYGFRISHYNFTGNRDPLKLKIHFGYTRKYELTYAIPYLALDNKLGIAGSIFYSENREIAYKTIGNKTQFEKRDDERKLLSRFRVGPEVKYRPTRNIFHSIRFEYHHNKIDPYVATELNPDYFFDSRTDLRFFYMEYDFNYDSRLYAHYPQGGFLVFGNLKKEGLGLINDYDNFSLTIGFEEHYNLGKFTIISSRNKAKANLNRNRVAFANNTGLGWNSDIVSGYELYVLDGTDYFISMNNIKKKLIDKNLNTISWVPRQFRNMNFTLFVRFNFDCAVVNEDNYVLTNNLNNRWIYGYGPSIDLLLFNNFLFSFEYSFNDIGERGLFFHNSFAF